MWGKVLVTALIAVLTTVANELTKETSDEKKDSDTK